MTTNPQPYRSGDVGRIPLVDHEGTLRAWVLVDADVLDWAAQWRWHLIPAGYAVRNVGSKTPDGRDGRTKLPLHRAVLGLPAQGEPRIGFLNDCQLDVRRSNLVVSPRWLVKRLTANPELGRALLDLGNRRLEAAA